MVRKMLLLAVILAMTASIAVSSLAQKASEMGEREIAPSPRISAPAERSEEKVEEVDVLFIGALDVGSWSAIYNEFSALPEIGTCDQFDAYAGTPTLAQLQGYAVAISFAEYPYADPDGLGNVLADYVDAGGKLILTCTNRVSPWNMGGRILSGGYDPLSVSGDTRSWDSVTLGSTIGHAITTTPYAIADLWAGFREICDVRPGATLVASWSDNAPCAAVEGSVVGIAVMPGYERDYFWGGQLPNLLANACVWLVGGGPSWPSLVYDKVFTSMGAMSALPALRAYRNDVLLGSPEGRELVAELYEARYMEAARILLTNASIRRRVRWMIMRNLSKIQKVVDGEQVSITSLELAAVKSLLKDIAKVASPDFGAYIDSVLKVLGDKDTLAALGVRVGGSIIGRAPGLGKDNLATTWADIKRGVQD